MLKEIGLGSALDLRLQPQVAVQAGTGGLGRYVLTSLSPRLLMSFGASPAVVPATALPPGERSTLASFS